MGNKVIQIANEVMLRRAIPRAVNSADPDETGPIAHAAARLIRSLTAKQIERWGADLLKLVGQEAPVAALKRVADMDRPKLAEMRLIADQLARKRWKANQIDILIQSFAEVFRLDALEQTILGIMARWSRYDAWRQLVRLSPNSGPHPSPSTLARLSGISTDLVEQRLLADAPLQACRMIMDDGDGEFSPSALFRRLVRLNIQTPRELLGWLMPPSQASMLRWDDFDHLGPLRDIAEKLVAAKEPSSILLYGPPGTGKTQFARALAARAGVQASFAGCLASNGNEPDRSERLDHLMLLRAVCAHSPQRMIVVDEADDVLSMLERKNCSKQWLNHLVESPQATTIWILNRREKLDPSLRRRMALAIGFEHPPVAVRERIVKRAAMLHEVQLSDLEAKELARNKTCPAVIASGIKAAQLTQGGAAVAQVAIHSVMRALKQSTAPEKVGHAVYDPKLSRADTDLARLADQLVAAPQRRWNLLLSGPSGTGKSAFARHLAERMGIEVEERRCSDLMSPYVGETEQKIAEAFAAAAERGALLLIDEADSFLYAREGDLRSWEVSRVNEILVQMEHARTPFVATTNLADNLDPACQRRFTMRVAFQALLPVQAYELFRTHFGQDVPQHAALHEHQTPGDFAVVAQRARLLGEQDPAVLARWLYEEGAARKGCASGAMGFQVSSVHAPAHYSRDKKMETP
jgi:transitional endoplasmic reticulum ATPase